MLIPAKVGAAVAGLGVLSTGLFFIVPGQPSRIFLSEDTSKGDSAYGSDTFGKKYSEYLVSSKKTSDKKPSVDNELWWNWSYKNWKNDYKDMKLSDDFKDENKISAAFAESSDNSQGAGSSDGKKALNQVCEEVYRKKVSDIELKTESSDSKQHESDIWRYCSFAGTKPLSQ